MYLPEIFSAGPFTVETHCNGWAFTVTDTRTGDTVFFQDHDADTLRAETEEFENLYALESIFSAHA